MPDLIRADKSKKVMFWIKLFMPPIQDTHDKN